MFTIFCLNDRANDQLAPAGGGKSRSRKSKPCHSLAFFATGPSPQPAGKRVGPSQAPKTSEQTENMKMCLAHDADSILRVSGHAVCHLHWRTTRATRHIQVTKSSLRDTKFVSDRSVNSKPGYIRVDWRWFNTDSSFINRRGMKTNREFGILLMDTRTWSRGPENRTHNLAITESRRRTCIKASVNW